MKKKVMKRVIIKLENQNKYQNNGKIYKIKFQTTLLFFNNKKMF
jgi:hypothetical protein